MTLPDNLSDYDLRALEAYIISPSGNEEPCFLKKLPKGNTGISFTPREQGEHLVSVKREGRHIREGKKDNMAWFPGSFWKMLCFFEASHVFKLDSSLSSDLQACFRLFLGLFPQTSCNVQNIERQ